MEPKIKQLARSKKITLTQLAKNLNISRGYLSSITHGHQSAGKNLAKAIEIWSEGQITHTELIYPKES
jgi:transcriptional regulator with XRE-family HTH domain